MKSNTLIILVLVCFGLVVPRLTSQTTTPCIQNPGAPNPWPNPAAADAGIIGLGNMGQPNVFSVSLWVKPNQNQHAVTVILDASHGGALNWVIQTVNGGQTWVFLGCEYPLQVGRWQHLLCTYNNGLSRVFVDGQLVDEANWAINWGRPGNVFLGNWPEGGRRFNGLVDELYITNNILYDANFIPLEIISNANILPNTFGLWHFDEGAGLVSQNSVNGVNTALNNWVWNARELNGPIRYSYQVATDLIDFSSPVKTRLLTGGGSGNIILKMPSKSGTLAVNPMALNAPVGVVVQNAAVAIPTGYVKCNGQAVSRSQYSSLFNQIGTTYGAGNGSSTFGLPDVGPIPVNGLVGWWPFNGNANDESGVGTNGVVTGAVLTTDRFGYANSAYYYDGNDEIVMPNYAQLVNAQGTVSVWFKTSFVGKQGLLFVTTMPGNLNEHVAICWYQSADRLEGDVKFNSGCQPGKGWSKAFAGLAYQDDKWHHALQTWGDGNVKLYVDGILVATQATPVNNADVCTNATLILTLGLGKVDDVAIYNRILTQDEIRRLYGSESPRIQSIIKN